MAPQPLANEAKGLLDLGACHVLQRGVATFQSIRLPVRLCDFAPSEGHHVILLYTLAKEIQSPEEKLSFGLARNGGFFKPRCCFDIILSNAETFVEQESETGLCLSIAAKSKRVPVAERGAVVTAIICGQARSKVAGSCWLNGRQ